MPKPFCFMIMPYGRKATQAEAGRGVPEIDFNALWDHAFAPTIIALGYEPVRADQDTGALIINQMIERLYFADLVLADMTIPNGNVYYEVGIRHAAREKGCVLLAADWSKQLFDVAQNRTVRYPMPEGGIAAATAQAISAAIKEPIRSLARGVSPMHAAIKGYPDEVDESAASTMKDVMTAMAAFQGEIRAVRALPRAARMARAKELVERYWTAAGQLADCAGPPAPDEGQRRNRRRLELDDGLYRQASRRCRGAGGGSRAERIRPVECRQAYGIDRQARSAGRDLRTDAGTPRVCSAAGTSASSPRRRRRLKG